MKKFVALLLLASFATAVCFAVPHYSKEKATTGYSVKKDVDLKVFVKDAQVIEVAEAPVVLHVENVEKPVATVKLVTPQTNSPPHCLV